MRAYVLQPSSPTHRLVLQERDSLLPQPGELRMQLRAASLNFRDLLLLDDRSSSQLHGRVPVSDGAGVVDAVGHGVSARLLGARVTTAFFPAWRKGAFAAELTQGALGGAGADGALAEEIVLPAAAAVPFPDHLTFEEAATLPCAGVTAWHAVVERGQVGAGDTVLIQGTGGVALFALQFASRLGANVVVISSSDEKLARATELGAAHVINYARNKEWDQAVVEYTKGRGVDFVLELGGAATIERSLRALGAGGRLAQIGVLTGPAKAVDLMRVAYLNADVMGILVGSVEHMTRMNSFIETHALRPVVDRVFPFEQAISAFEHLRASRHFGKVVVRIR